MRRDFTALESYHFMFYVNDCDVKGRNAHSHYKVNYYECVFAWISLASCVVVSIQSGSTLLL